MNEIKITFAKDEYLVALLNDKEFMINEAGYMNPRLVDGRNMQFSDPKKEHNPVDSEEVVLRLCAYAVKRILFDNVAEISYLSSEANKMKKGIIFSLIDNVDGIPIVINTTVF